MNYNMQYCIYKWNLVNQDLYNRDVLFNGTIQMKRIFVNIIVKVNMCIYGLRTSG